MQTEITIAPNLALTVETSHNGKHVILRINRVNEFEAEIMIANKYVEQITDALMEYRGQKT